LEEFFDAMTAPQGMSEYLQVRPALIKVGRGLKLVIDGVEHPTDVQKT
jgi:hypothetical protein